MNKTKRVLLMADLHCGSRAGLTPPGYGEEEELADGKISLWREMWDTYITFVASVQPVDVLLVLGDCIEGKGTRQEGLDLITADRNIQIEMAAEAIRYIAADHTVVIGGTPYHSGVGEDFEKQLEDKVPNCQFALREWVDINGVVFDLKHKIGTTTIPHGRFTPLAREKLWNYLWSLHGEQPNADVIVRAHVHWCAHCGEPGWLALSLPGLQAPVTRIGKQLFITTVHWGVVYFTVEPDGDFTWRPLIKRLQAAQVEPLKL